MTFETLWNAQETFYLDRPLMFKANQDIVFLSKRVEEEAEELREEIETCQKYVGPTECVNLLQDKIKQEVEDLFLFVMAIARCCGMSGEAIISGCLEKIARNMCRYEAKDYQDETDMFTDKTDASRRWDKNRKFTEQFYRIDA